MRCFSTMMSSISRSPFSKASPAKCLHLVHSLPTLMVLPMDLLFDNVQELYLQEDVSIVCCVGRMVPLLSHVLLGVQIDDIYLVSWLLILPAITITYICLFPFPHRCPYFGFHYNACRKRNREIKEETDRGETNQNDEQKTPGATTESAQSSEAPIIPYNCSSSAIYTILVSSLPQQCVSTEQFLNPDSSGQPQAVFKPND